MSLFFPVFSELLCPECEFCCLELHENPDKKQGLASLLYLKCKNCKFTRDFYTCPTTLNGGFDVNQRIVYSMRSLGNGHSTLKKFNTLMNISSPVTLKNYNKIVTKLLAAAKAVAEETMLDASRKIHEKASLSSDSIADTGVSCDGTSHKRGFSSCNGVFAAISMVNGKVIDVEPMSHYCKGCHQNNKLQEINPTAYAEWRNGHICRYNYVGKAGAMESEGAKRVFERSINKYKLRYVLNILEIGTAKAILISKIYISWL